MNTLSWKLGPLLGWQILVLVLALAGAGGVAYVSVEATTGNGSGGIAANEQIVPALIDDLVDSVSTSGTVAFPERETVRFSAAGTVGEVLASEGDLVSAGDTLATLDAASLATLQVAAAKAQVTLNAAEDALVEAMEGPEPVAVATAAAAVLTAADALSAAAWSASLTVAQDALASAQTAYIDVYDRWLGIAISTSDLSLAPSTLLAGWDTDLDVLFDPSLRQTIFVASPTPTPVDDPATKWNETTIHTWVSFFPGELLGTCPGGEPTRGACVESEMEAAWDALAVARAALPAAEAVAATAEAAAKDSLAKAETDLAAAELGTSEAALTLLVAERDEASAKLTAAQEARTGATLVAPMAGTVTTVSMEAGDSAAGQAISLEIVDTTVIEVAGTVDEIDVLALEEGVPASVTLTSLPGQVLSGTISEIGDAGTSQQGVVTYPISVQIEVPAGLSLREGLSATASVVVNQLSDVLLIPAAAVLGNFVQPYVRVVNGGGVEERDVLLGASDDFWVVVSEGLADGEEVIMPAPSSGDTGFAGLGGLLGGRGGLGGSGAFVVPGGAGGFGGGQRGGGGGGG